MTDDDNPLARYTVNDRVRFRKPDAPGWSRGTITGVTVTVKRDDGTSEHVSYKLPYAAEECDVPALDFEIQPLSLDDMTDAEIASHIEGMA